MKRSLMVLTVCAGILVSCSNNEEVVEDTSIVEAAAVVEAVEPKKPMVPSVIFVQYLNQQAPILFCQQDPSIACLQMPTELCVASVESSIERCGPKLLEQWPASFEESEENAVKFSKQYRNCMLNDWVSEYGLEQERLTACGIVLDS